MISMKELLMGRAKFEDLDKEIQNNLVLLFEKINKIREKYAKPMKVNDGLRLSAGNGAKKSKHLEGLAVDIDDNEEGELWFWLMEHEQMQLLKDVGLWLEHGDYTHYPGGSWVHFQCLPPGSGKRIFIPNNGKNPNPEFWNDTYDEQYD
jgi:hypothetical protein